MQLSKFLELFPDVELTAEQLFSCRLLESEGLRFLIDFGYENAPSMAWDRLERSCSQP